MIKELKKYLLKAIKLQNYISSSRQLQIQFSEIMNNERKPYFLLAFALNIENYLKSSAAARISVSGNTLGGQPPDAGEFSKICKRFRKNIAQMYDFILISKMIKHCVKISRVLAKNTIGLEIF